MRKFFRCGSQLTVIAWILFGLAGVTVAADQIRTYADAHTVWKENSDRAEYSSYANSFSQFNNYYRLDEKNGCYSLAQEPVTLMLVITPIRDSSYSVIDSVFSDVENAKARCFVNTYRGLKTKVPPFFPFVLQMSMQ